MTVFDLRSKAGYCFMWDETVAKRGSCEIASCLWLWLKNLPQMVERVTLYSDSCSGQNKNINMLTMMMAAVNVLPIKQIDHKFLESGHSQMEVDSMHATIERASHSAYIFVPRDWVTIASVVKKEGETYSVRTMRQIDFTDFKTVSAKLIQNKNKLDSGKHLSWIQCKWFQYSKGSSTVKVKMALDDGAFDSLCTGTVASDAILFDSNDFMKTMTQMYKSPIPISTAKYNDLKFLCKKKVIDADFHQYFADLKHSSSAADKLDAPDVDEDSDYDDTTDIASDGPSNAVMQSGVDQLMPSALNRASSTTRQRKQAKIQEVTVQSGKVTGRKRHADTASATNGSSNAVVQSGVDQLMPSVLNRASSTTGQLRFKK
jgi:hypothetical protein